MGEQDMERELVKLVEGPQSMDTLYRISEIYIELGRLDKASESLIGCVGAYFQKPGTVKKALDIADMGIKHWKLTRYSNKEQLRINLGDDRAKMLSTVLKLLELAQKNHQKESKEEHKNRITFMIAFINENVGMLQEALQAYSDLIALQAMDCGVDLTFIIMKASVILTHVGNHSQAVEYLEFLLDDPPATEGYGRTHILAFLAMTYEHHPKRADFATTLKKTYALCSIFVPSFLVCDVSVSLYRFTTACLHSLTLHDTSLTVIFPSINHQSTQYSHYLL
jgi:tetratricopeptide (TPR) repeat protein